MIQQTFEAMRLFNDVVGPVELPKPVFEQAMRLCHSIVKLRRRSSEEQTRERITELKALVLPYDRDWHAKGPPSKYIVRQYRRLGNNLSN